MALATFSWNDYHPTKSTIRKCKQMAATFHEDVTSKELHQPKSMILIPYNLFRGLCRDYTKGSEYAYYDGDFWTDPQREGTLYGPEVPLSSG